MAKKKGASPFDTGAAAEEARGRLLTGIRSLEPGRVAEDRVQALELVVAYKRLEGDDEALQDALTDVLGTLERLDIQDEAERVLADRPDRREARRLEAGRGLIRFVQSMVEFDEKGSPIVPTIAEVVKARWPAMRFYENAATEKLESRGLWLEIRDGRWHRLLTSAVDQRVRRVVRAKADGGRVESEHINKQAREAMRDLHSQLLAGATDQIDASDHLLDSTGLPIDLREGKPCSPDWKHPLMRRLAVEYRPDVKSRVFEAAVRQCLEAGRTEEQAAEVFDWFRRITGYMLLKHKKEQIFVLNVGVGNNGKSTIMEAQMNYLGDACAHTMDPDPLLQDFKGDPLTGFNSMIGKLMTLVEELPEGKAVSPATLKRLSGGRKMEVRKRYEDNKVVRMTSMLWINSNVRPSFWDNTTGWGRRYVFLEWMMDFTAAVVNKDMPTELEGDGPGWLNYALEGLRDYLKMGEARPLCVQEDTRAYAESSGDPLRTFYDRFFTKKPGAAPLLVKDVKAAYQNWLLNTDEVNDEDHAKRFSGTPQKFRKKVTDMTGRVEKRGGNMHWLVDHEMADDPLLGLMTATHRTAAGLGVAPIPPEGSEGMTDVTDADWGS